MLRCCVSRVYSLADPREGGARTPPGSPNSFIFMQFSVKKLKNNITFGSWRAPLGKILDPPLVLHSICFSKQVYFVIRFDIGFKFMIGNHKF